MCQLNYDELNFNFFFIFKKKGCHHDFWVLGDTKVIQSLPLLYLVMVEFSKQYIL